MGIILAVGAICGIACAFVASSKGRNPVGWFFIGFFFHLLAFIICCVLSNLKEEQRERAHSAEERRRLREQLRQEKMKADAFQRHAGARLDSHDQVLGVDTRGATPLGADPAGAIGLAGAPPPPLPGAGRQWHFSLGEERKGPVTESALRELVASGVITSESLVWTDGMPDWTLVKDVPGLSA